MYNLNSPKMPDAESIPLKKYMSKIKNDLPVYKSCLLCGKDVKGFCNSHSIPAFCLKNIATDGKLYTFNSIIEVEILPSESGVNKSGVFYAVCRDCDSSFFQDYENEQNYLSSVSPKMLWEIEIKNLLRSYHARIKNGLLARRVGEDVHSEKKQMVNQIANVELLSAILSIKQYSQLRQNQNIQALYDVIYFKKLNYIVPIAFQDSVSLFADCQGNVVNNLYKFGSKIQNLNICIFPMKQSSVLLMFTQKRNSNYKKFKKQIQFLDDDSIQKLMLQIMFLYSENFFYSKKMEDILKKDSIVNKLSETTTIIENSKTNNQESYFYLAQALEAYSLKNFMSMTNYLSKEYQVVK